jgi:hypothetical protein
MAAVSICFGGKHAAFDHQTVAFGPSQAALEEDISLVLPLSCLSVESDPAKFCKLMTSKLK